MGSGEDGTGVVLREVIHRHVRNHAVEGLPGVAAIGAVEDAHVGSREDAVTTRISAADTVVGIVDQNLKHWDVG